jgi:hypothetical protein
MGWRLSGICNGTGFRQKPISTPGTILSRRFSDSDSKERQWLNVIESGLDLGGCPWCLIVSEY